jgi:hypothetical protein
MFGREMQVFLKKRRAKLSARRYGAKQGRAALIVHNFVTICSQKVYNWD